VTEKVADRVVALPFHSHLTEDQIAFIVATMKDASINVGAERRFIKPTKSHKTNRRSEEWFNVIDYDYAVRQDD